MSSCLHIAPTSRTLTGLRSGLAALLLPLLFLLTACGGGTDDGGSSNTVPPGTTLGVAGGTATSSDGNLTLSVAAGALSGDTRFSTAAESSVDGLSTDYVLVPGTAYQVDWNGAGFVGSNSVTVQITDTSANAADALRAHALGARRLADPVTPNAMVVHCSDGSTVIYIVPATTPGYETADLLLCPPNSGTAGTSHSSSTVGVVKPAPGVLPSITAQPVDASVTAGQSANFTVVATGTSSSPLHYQWQREGVDIAGATAASYSFVTALADDGSHYAVVVSNVYGKTLSYPVTLTVTATGSPVVVQAPQDATTQVGGTTVFSITVKGAAPLSYQWSGNGVPLSDRAAAGSDSGIAGSQTASLTLSNAQFSDAGIYSLVVSNGQSPDATANVSLVVNAAPATTWTRLLGSTAAVWGNAVALDAAGNAYVVGTTNGVLDGQASLGGVSDAFIAKFDASGTKQWTRQFGSGGSDTAIAVGIDASGNVYVAGTTDSWLTTDTPAGFRDGFLAKFDSNGQRLWTRQFGGSGDDLPKGIAIDGAGNVYVAGYTGSLSFGGQTVTASGSAFLVQYHADGSAGWVQLWRGTDNTEADGVAADAAGSVYVVGTARGSVNGQAHTQGTAFGDYDVFVTRFAAATGAQGWTREWGSVGDNLGTSIAVDGAGNILVAGMTLGPMYSSTRSVWGWGNNDAFLTKLSASGTELWGVQWTVGAVYSTAYQVALDTSGNAYVVGSTQTDQFSLANLYVSKFDTNGVAKGSYLHSGGAAGVQPEGVGLAIDSNGQGVACGNVNGGPFDGNSNAGGQDAYLHRFILP